MDEADKLKTVRDEELLSTRLVSLENEILAMKSNQISGGENIKSYSTETSATWDLDRTGAGSQTIIQLRAVFTAAHKPASMVAWEITAYINNQPHWQVSNPPVEFRPSYRGQQSPNKDIAKYQTGLAIPIALYGPANLKIKVRAVSTDTGTLSVFTV